MATNKQGYYGPTTILKNKTIKYIDTQKGQSGQSTIAKIVTQLHDFKSVKIYSNSISEVQITLL